MTNAAQAPLGPGGAFRVLRELGRRTRRTFAAIREPHEVLVLQRFVRDPSSSSSVPPATGTSSTSPVALPADTATMVSAEQIALLLRDARCLEKNWHPNIARVKHVSVASGDLRVATELVDGATLADLATAALARSKEERERLLSLPVLLRVLVDVLGGLHGLHGLRDGINASIDAMHGELSPANVVVGRDGVARLVAVLRPRPVHLSPGSEATGYAAPEMTDATAATDPRADIYAVGVMLWEAISGQRLFERGDVLEIAQRQRSEELDPPRIAASSPFARLGEVAMRALSFDPALRFRSASEMASEIRRIAGTRLAPGSAVAQTLAELCGDRIRARRAELDPIASGTRRRAGADVEPSKASPPPAVERVQHDSVTGEIPRTPAAADGEEEEVTKVSPNAKPEMTAAVTGPVRRGKPADPPRRAPEENARYLVVPPRPMLESVDSDALASASGEPSTARLKQLGPPGLPNAAPEEEIEEDDVETAVGRAPPGISIPPPLPSGAKKPTSAATPNVPRATPKPGKTKAVPSAAEAAAAVAAARPAPTLTKPTSTVPRLWADSSPEITDTATAVTPEPPATAAAAPATAAAVPRLWTESSHDVVSTNVLEGDFVRALKADARTSKTPPAPSAAPPAPATPSALAVPPVLATPAAPPPSPFAPAPSAAPPPIATNVEVVPVAPAPSFPATPRPAPVAADAQVASNPFADLAPAAATPMPGGASAEEVPFPLGDPDAERRKKARTLVMAIVGVCVLLLGVALVVSFVGDATSPATDKTDKAEKTERADKPEKSGTSEKTADTPSEPATTAPAATTAATASAALSSPTSNTNPTTAEPTPAAARPPTPPAPATPAAPAPVAKPASPPQASPPAAGPRPPAPKGPRKPSYDPLGI